MVSLPNAPLLSVTLNSKRYTPCTIAVTVVVAEFGLVILPAVGPAILVHRYAVILPSASVPLPESVAVLIGKVMTWSGPAFATGGIFAAGLTVTCMVSLPNAPLLSVTLNEKR